MSLTFNGAMSGGIGGYQAVDQLMYNLKWWLDWSLLHVGGFDSILLGSGSYYDITEAELRPVDDQRYSVGAVWEGLGREWVWESGVGVFPPPFRPSGVFIDNVFYPYGSSGFGSHHIDYQNGRIIFDSSQSPASIIQAEYCKRTVFVGFGDDPLLRILMAHASMEFDVLPSGLPGKEGQLWLPSLFIAYRGTRSRGLQLGGGQIKTHQVSVFVFADSPGDRNSLLSILDMQNRKTLNLCDLNQISMPLDTYGDLASGAMVWPEMVDAFPWKKARFTSGTSAPLSSLNPTYFRGRVDWDIELDFGGV